MQGEVISPERIEKAVEASKRDNVTGKAITGYLMKYLKETIGDSSIDAQVAMIRENAVLSARLSAAI